MSKWTEDLCLKNILGPGGCLPLPLGYIHVYDHNIETSSSLKPLGQSKPTFFLEHPKEEGIKVGINGQGHMTKMAGKNV